MMKIHITRLHAFSGDSPEMRAYERDFFASHVSFKFVINPGTLSLFPMDAMFEIPDQLYGAKACVLIHELAQNLVEEKSSVRAYSLDGRKHATYYKDGSVVFKEDDFDCAMCTEIECPLHIPEYLRMTAN